MDHRNATVSFYFRDEDWKGSVTQSLVGEYDVWEEPSWETPYKGERDRKEIHKGMIFLFTDLDLTNCFVRIDSRDFEITDYNRFVDRHRDFHHIEVLYK